VCLPPSKENPSTSKFDQLVLGRVTWWCVDVWCLWWRQCVLCVELFPSVFN